VANVHDFSLDSAELPLAPLGVGTVAQRTLIAPLLTYDVRSSKGIEIIRSAYGRPASALAVSPSRYSGASNLFAPIIGTPNCFRVLCSGLLEGDGR